MYARAGKWKLIFLYVSTARKWNSKIGIDIYNSKMKIEIRTWQIESNVVYIYTSYKTKNEYRGGKLKWNVQLDMPLQELDLPYLDWLDVWALSWVH